MKNLNQIKLYCLDMDGTIYLDDVLIPNVIETLNFLREKARIVFLTNNSSKSKDAYIENDVYGSDHCPVGLVLEF